MIGAIGSFCAYLFMLFFELTMQLNFTFSIFSSTVIAMFGNIVSNDIAQYVERKWLHVDSEETYKVQPNSELDGLNNGRVA